MTRAGKAAASQVARELSAELGAIGAEIAVTPAPGYGVWTRWARRLELIAEQLGAWKLLRRLDVLALRGLVVELRTAERVLCPRETGAGLTHLARVLIESEREPRPDAERRALRPVAPSQQHAR